MSFFTENVTTSQRAKAKDGDESEKQMATLGTASGSWMEMLNDGSENPYPITSAALKAKNSRDGNDIVR